LPCCLSSAGLFLARHRWQAMADRSIQRRSMCARNTNGRSACSSTRRHLPGCRRRRQASLTRPSKIRNSKKRMPKSGRRRSRRSQSRNRACRQATGIDNPKDNPRTASASRSIRHRNGGGGPPGPGEIVLLTDLRRACGEAVRRAPGGQACSSTHSMVVRSLILASGPFSGACSRQPMSHRRSFALNMFKSEHSRNEICRGEFPEH
jgi:hypothetical protein